MTDVLRNTSSAEIVYGITSHTQDSASAARLLAYNRDHWGIENALHWRRDAVFAEDRSPVRKGFGPQNMAAIRNLAIGLLGMVVRTLSKKVDFPSLLRHHARSWRHVFSLLGL